MKKQNEELSEEEVWQRIKQKINYDYEMSFSEMEKELSKVESLRQRSADFENKFNALKDSIEEIAETRINRDREWTAESIVKAFDNFNTLYAMSSDDSPLTTLRIAYREYKILAKYIKKINETLNIYGEELIKQYSLNKKTDA